MHLHIKDLAQRLEQTDIKENDLERNKAVLSFGLFYTSGSD